MDMQVHSMERNSCEVEIAVAEILVKFDRMEAAAELLIRLFPPATPEGKPLVPTDVRQKFSAAEELVERHLSDIASWLLPDDFWMTARDLCDSRDRVACNDWLTSNELGLLAVSFEPRSHDVHRTAEGSTIERLHALARECDRGRSYFGGLIDAVVARQQSLIGKIVV
jgi:hypothetical protein